MSDEHTAHVFDRYQHGDDSAADELFYRYLDRLTALARTRLSPALARRVDPEDIALSAYRSFFVGAKDGRFAIERSGALWALLVKITLRKLYRSAAHHGADKRDMNRELEFNESQHPLQWTSDRQPTADEVVAISDALRNLMETLDVSKRRVFELRLLGEQMEQIAIETGQSERSVRRTLKKIETELQAKDQHESDSSPTVLPPGFADIQRLVSASQTVEPDCDEDIFKFSGEQARWQDLILQQQVGIGGMARVYQATQRTTGRTVAVKFLRKVFHQYPLAKRQLLREGELIARMNHPNVIKIHGLGETPGGGLFIVMDYIDGSADFVQSKNNPGFQLSIQLALQYTAQAAAGIQHAHENGIVHCDLKPSNILISDRAIVTDFGLARSLNNQQRPTSLVGTAAFMAPEQIDGSRGSISERTDVYGLGAVLFNLLTGRPPVIGNRVADILATTIQGQAESVPSQFRNVNPSVDEICQRCLQLEPDQRFQSAKALRTAIETAAAQIV